VRRKVAGPLHLDLTSTRVTDTGLSDLKALAQLRLLILAGTRVTTMGLKSLKRALSDARIIR
jgi:hypothetical protein